jgi:hypothetical protein
MSNYKLCTTQVDLQSKLVANYVPLVQDDTHIRSLVGALQYLTFTQSDISYAVQQVCLHMHNLGEPHLAAIICIMCYLQSTLKLGLLLHRYSTSYLIVYTDSDYARCQVPPIHLWLHGVFLGQPDLLVFQTSEHDLPLKC